MPYVFFGSSKSKANVLLITVDFQSKDVVHLLPDNLGATRELRQRFEPSQQQSNGQSI